MTGTQRTSDRRRRASGRRAVVMYGAAWLAAAACVVVVAVVALDGSEPEAVSLPPVEETELGDAARAAGCELRRQRRGAQLNPPVTGAAGFPPARAGVYEHSPDIGSLVAALRQGVIVIQVRTGLDESRLDELRTIQASAPNGTIVTPNETGMRFELAVTAYGHLLGCAEVTDASIEALLLFRGRYVGSGPDT
jgi:hypothetical protein